MKNLTDWWRSTFTSWVMAWVKYHTSGNVAAGPFHGLRYPPPYECGNAVPAKLLGIYENELHGALVELSAADFDHVVNIGASEGYYAAGLAMRLPAVEVLAYEASSEARNNLNKLIAFNDLEKRVHVNGICDAEVMDELGRRLNPHKTLVICDIEGGEEDILNAAKHPWLRHAKIIFETHDFARVGSSDKIIASFASTHQATRIPTVPRTGKDLPVSLPGFLLKRVLLVVGDQRLHLGAQDFVILTPFN